MIGRGDQRFLSLFDDSDGYDAPVGSFVTLNNFVPNKNWSSMSGRGAFVEHLEMPSVGNGLTTGLSIYKILDYKQWRVTQPEEKVMTLLVAVCTYAPTGGVPVYMLRFFQNPSYTGSLTALYPAAGSFGTPTSWRDVTPYYIDIVNTNVDIVELGTTKSLDDIGAASNGGYHLQDFVNGYIYLEDPFTSPNNHDAEGDKIVTVNSYSVSTNILEVIVESVSSGWARTANTMRLHKNLTTGKIPYLDLCSTSSTFFDTYRFSFETLGEGLLVSCNTGNSTRASWTFKLEYVNRKLFGLGNIWGRADHVYDGVDRLYDRHLVYGFPGYDYVIKAASIFDSQTVDLWDVGVHPTTGAGTYSGTITNGTYNKNRGSFDVGSGFVAATQSPSNRLYRVGRGNPRDISVYLNDFFFQEMDVHGRWGTPISFSDIGNSRLMPSHHRFAGNTAGITYGFYNRPEYTATANVDGIPVDTDEQSFTNGYFIYGLLMSIYDKFRIGLHSEHTFRIGAASMILGVTCTVPASFCRFITGLACCFTTEEDSVLDFNNTKIALAVQKIFEDFEDAEGWDFHLTAVTNTGSIGLWHDDYRYVKVFRYDKQREANVNLGGNHLLLTGNPSYSKSSVSSGQDSNAELSFDATSGLVTYDIGTSFTRSSRHIAKDFSFGAEHMVSVQDLLFIAGVRFQDSQMNQTPDVFFDDRYNVFYSGFGKFGGNFHLFDSALRKWGCREIGEITGLAVASIPQGLDSATKQDQSYVVILAENGYKLLFLYPPTDPNGTFDQNWNDVTAYTDCCVAPKSVVSEAGYVFCAGNQGVYMFEGSKKTDLTEEFGHARVNKSWRSVSRADKQNAIGVFYRERKWYVLIVPGTSTFYCFDIVKRQIFNMTYASMPTEPAASATGLSFSTYTPTSMTLSFTPSASTDGYLVLVKDGAAVTETPTDGFSYDVGDTIGGATVAAVVFSTASPTNVVVSNLIATHTYHYAIFSFNGGQFGIPPNYRTTSPLTGSRILLEDVPVNPATYRNTGYSYTDAPVAADGGIIGILANIESMGATNNGVMIVYRVGSAVTHTPVNGQVYVDHEDLGDGHKTVSVTGAFPQSIQLRGSQYPSISPDETIYLKVYSFKGSDYPETRAYCATAATWVAIDNVTADSFGTMPSSEPSAQITGGGGGNQISGNTVIRFGSSFTVSGDTDVVVFTAREGSAPSRPQSGIGLWNGVPLEKGFEYNLSGNDSVVLDVLFPPLSGPPLDLDATVIDGFFGGSIYVDIYAGKFNNGAIRFVLSPAQLAKGPI